MMLDINFCGSSHQWRMQLGVMREGKIARQYLEDCLGNGLFDSQKVIRPAL